MNKKNHILQNARYHKFILSDGTVVMPKDGHDFFPVLDVIFPSRIDGKTLFDIGCSNGFYTIEAAKRGAICSGLEQSPSFLETAQLIAEDSSVEIDFIRGRWPQYSENIEDNRFDIILLMNVIHHSPTREESIYQLTEAMRVTADTLILCVSNKEDKPDKIYHTNNDIKNIVSSKFRAEKVISYLEAGGNCDGRTVFVCKRKK